MKMFEYNIVLIGVFVAVWFLEKPSFKRHFVAGIFVGLAAFFGRNHGLYNFLAFFFLVLFAWHKGERSFLIKKGFLWGCGIVVGYSPMLFMIGVIPGFGDSFLRTVIAVAKYSNIKRAVPWPWTIDYTKLDWIMSFHKFGVGALFMLLPVFYVYSLITALRSSREEILARRVMIASSFIGLFYLHHAYNRGDWSYLTQSIHPFLVGIISVPCLFITDSSRKTARIVIVAVCFIMALVILPRDPLYKMSRDPEKFVYYDVAGDQIKMKKGTARMIRCMKKLNKKLFKEEDGFLIAPMWPGLYPLLDKPSPVWTLFFLRPATEEFQNTMIADMEKNNVKWVVIGNIAPEGKNENRFKNTHTVMWRHINANYSPVPDACVTKRNKKYTLYKKDGESFVIKNKRDEAKKAAAIKKIKKKKAPPPIIFFPDSMPRDSNPSRPGKAKPPE